MKTYIALLRGINVSGKNSIKMLDLRELFLDLLFKNVHTYIQSGNVVFQFKETENSILEKKINQAIQKTFSFDVPTIVLDFDHLKTVVVHNIFLKDSSKDLAFFHITFLNAKPIAENFEKIKIGNYQSDLFELIDKTIYLYCPNGYGNTRLTNAFFESKLRVQATTRNWKTTLELLSMAEKLNEL
jgi:uncharacterized protein (DUF1697 family)